MQEYHLNGANASPVEVLAPPGDFLGSSSGLLTDKMHIREPFRFVFKGYSVWLELRQTDRDLERAVSGAALDNALYPIPEPHCTVIYGVSHKTEDEALRCFRDKVVPTIKYWPAVECTGSHVGISYDGVDGEEMDMAWMEISLRTSPDHEYLVDQVHNCYYDDCDDEPRRGPWHPHISLAYDNPEDSAIDDVSAANLFAQYPTLLSTISRDVLSISLWKTEGRLWDWKCIDRHVF